LGREEIGARHELGERHSFGSMRAGVQGVSPISQGDPGSWPGGSARFGTTQWTMIAEAGGDGRRRDEAFESFCRAYWYPLYAFLRRRGEAAEDARDLVQGFFLQMIEKDWLAGVEKRQSRFSTLLLTVMERHLISAYRRATAEKRGGRVTVSIDLAEAEAWFGKEPSNGESPEQIFERRWALAVLAAGLQRLQEDCQAAGRARLFETLSPFLSREPEAGEYDTAAVALGLNRRSVAVAVHRLRRDFREMVRTEVAAGLVDPARVDEEMRCLAAALR